MNGKTRNYQKPSEIDVAVPSWIIKIGDPPSEATNAIFNETPGSEFVEFTWLDLFGTSAFSFQELKLKIHELLGVWKNKKNRDKQIPLFNTIYVNSLNYLERVLYRQVPRAFKDKKWESLDDFIIAVQSHTNRDINGAYSLIFCAILKIMLVEIELVNKIQTIDNLDKDMDILRCKVETIPGFNILKNNKDTDYKSYILDSLYQWKMEYRPKSIDSIRTKMIYNRKYNGVDKFQDLLAMRFELDDSMWQSWYIHTILRLKKGLYEKLQDDYDVNLQIKWNILTKESLETLRKNRIQVIEPPFKWWSSLEYEDAKFIGGKIRLENGKRKRTVSPEIQFVLAWNRNEAGFSNHHIYDFKKILSANARLFGAITLWNLKYILAKYKTPIDPRALLAHLLYPQEWQKKPFLYILRAHSTINNELKTYFSTSDIYDVKKWEAQITIQKLYKKFPRVEGFSESNTARFASLAHKAIDDIMNKSGDSVL